MREGCRNRYKVTRHEEPRVCVQHVRDEVSPLSPFLVSLPLFTVRVCACASLDLTLCVLC